MNNKDKKNIMIIFLLIAIVFMSVGYALLSTKLDDKENKFSKEAVWDVKIASISTTTTEGSGMSLNEKIESNFSAKFNTELTMPDDKVSYTINIKNEGTIPAKLDSITITPENDSTSFMKYTIEGIEAGDIINPEESKTFILNVSYNKENEETPTKEDLTKEIILILNYIQKR